jgi:chitinase
MISTGGWGGSRFFSTDVGSSANRTTFVKTLVNFTKQYQLDGIDFDWEYPGNQGIGCNAISPNDTSNFLSFLQLLRSDPDGKKLILTAATSIVPFYNANGNPSTDVSTFAKVLDYINVMKWVDVLSSEILREKLTFDHDLTPSYDVYGPWSPTVGPNAPLNDSCAPPEAQMGSAASAVSAWTSAGMPANRIVMGVPSYGHSYRVKPSDAYVNGKSGTLKAYPSFDAADQPDGDAWDDETSTDSCGNVNGPGGTWNFRYLVPGGWITADGKPARGIDYRYDDCSQTVRGITRSQSYILVLISCRLIIAVCL